MNEQVIAWRRDIHANPELGMQEFGTAALVAEHLESLGIEVETGVGGTGVVGVLRGGRPGPVVALRADMDALPVTEQVDLPFASTATAMWQGREVGVMNAFITQHQLRPLVDKVFTFDNAPAAYDHMASGNHMGKIVIASF